MNGRISTIPTLTAAAMLAAACASEPFPIDLRIEHEGASNPTVAVTPDGMVLTAWVGTQRDSANVYLSRVSPDGVVHDPIRVNDVLGDASPHEQAPAQVAAGSDGLVHVVWQATTPIEERRFPASDLRYARSTDGGRTFTPAVTVNDDTTGPPSSHTFHNVVAGDDGLIAVSWLDGRVGDSLRTANHDITEDQLPGSDIRVAVSRDGGKSFTHQTVVDTNVCPCCRTSLAWGSDGAIFVSWRKVFDGDIRDIVVAASRDGGKTFEPPVRVHEDDWVYAGCPHAGPDLAVDAEGRLQATWYTGAQGRTGLYHAASADGGMTFGFPTSLTGSQPPTQAKLGVDEAGVVWLAWERRGPDGDAILTDRISATSWRPNPFWLGAGRSPALAARGERRAVAWLGEDGAVRIRIGPS
jgi:hypothetical protein